MENTSTPFIIIKLDTERKFRLSNKAIYIFESQFNKSVIDIEFDGLSITETNQIIYAGLKSQDDSITFEKVIDLIDEYMNYEKLMKIITKALEGSNFLSLTDSEEVKPAEKN